MKALLKNIIQAPASTFAGAIIAALGVFIASEIPMPMIVMVSLMAVAAFLSIFSGPNKPNSGPKVGNLNITMFFLTLSALALSLPSCSPTSYVADLSTYGPSIEANPTAVVLDPEDVTPVGGFQTDLRGQVDTEYGTVGDDDGTIFTDVVIDLDPTK